MIYRIYITFFPLALLVLSQSGDQKNENILRAEPDSTVECRWTDRPIVIDGKADEEAWKFAQKITNFARPWQKDAPPLRGKTTAKLLWDREYLYFTAEMTDQDIFADITTHDGELWRNDNFELFFQPDPTKPGYFEFEVNAANTVLDAFFPKRDIDGINKQLSVGEFRLESKVTIDGTLNKRDDRDTKWVVEGRIPWIDFLRAGGRPEMNETWRMGLFRCNYDQGKPDELSGTANIAQKKLSAYFHQTEDYGLVKFVGPTKATRLPRGIEEYQPITTNKVVGSPEPPLPYQVKRVYPEFAPKFPIMVKAIPGTEQLIIISEDRPYTVSAVHVAPDRPDLKTADMRKLFDTPSRGTMYDVCFHPQFAKNGYVYFGWNGDHPTGKVKKKASRVTRYTMKLQPEVQIDPASATTIIEWESDGHNGAAICFGNDGMLYITSGDGTSDSDVDEKGQSTDTLLSKLLRIDVDQPDLAQKRPYSIPKDNPFVMDARFTPETYAYGLRNPWRIASDAKTGHIWVGNNGQDLWEQAYLVRPGDNYGWSVMEGGHPFYLNRQRGPTPIISPTIEHHHAEFRSLTGGEVHHGKGLPDLQGAYIYGDYSTGAIWAMKHDGQKPVWHKQLASSILQITAFGHNTRGELIICDHSPESGLYTLVPTPKVVEKNSFPRKLSETGLYAVVSKNQVQPGAIPYSVNAPFWSDGMYKDRFLILPPETKIDYKAQGSWNFPEKTVIVKNFAMELPNGHRKWLETRFMTKQQGQWVGYSYRWNEAGTDADLVDAAGLDVNYDLVGEKEKKSVVWHYPSRTECLVCHSRAANFVLGLSTAQLNRTHDYGTCTDNQLQVFEHLQLLNGLEWTNSAREQIKARGSAKAYLVRT
ncbi:MAG: PQQ-dependent sugar dehydrogenase [Zavarzinella sp.]